MLEYPEFPVLEGSLEIRVRGGGRSILRGSFPYDKTATVRSRGRVRKERFNSGSMSWQVREFQKLQAQMGEAIDSALDEVRKRQLIDDLDDALERRNTHLLVGHDFNRSIADMRTGHLRVNHTRAAVELEADLPDPDDMPSWVSDAVKATKGGQLRGVSPGFNVPAKGAERLVPEAGAGDSMVREIQDAVVYEYSLVARPSYAGTTLDARAEDLTLPRRRRLWL